MVNVNKNIVPGKSAESLAKTEPKAPARRPRNQELNSSKKTSGQSKLAALKKQKLNCSAGNIPAGYEPYYEVISEQEFADTVGTDVDNLREIVAEIENEYNEKVVGYLTAKTKYADAFVDADIDSGFITESGKVLNGSDDGYIGTGEMESAAARVNDKDSLDSACGENLDSSAEDTTEGEGEPEFPYSASDVDMEGEETIIADDLGIDPARIKEVRYSDDEYAKVYLTDGSAIIIADSSRNGHHKWADASFLFNSSRNQSVNCSEGITWRSDKDMLESIKNALSEATAEPGYSEHAYLDDDAEIQFFVGQYNPSDNTVRVSSADNKSWFHDGVPADAKEILKYAKEYIAWREKNGKEGELDSACGGKDSSKALNCSEITEDDFEYGEDGEGVSTKDYMGYTIYKSIPDEASGSSAYMVYDGDYPQSFGTLEECKEFIRDTLNSSKKLNCSEDDVVTITTESGNEVPLSEVKVIQNPSTNELMLYVPENGDDEIPEGFTVVYDVVQQGSGSTPDPEDTGDGEKESKLDSSRQNRAARRRARKLNSSKKKNRR